MEKNKYFKSFDELVEGDEYFTQLEKWETNEMGEYFYTGKYISHTQLKTLQDTEQQDIVDILRATHDIAVRREHKSLVFQNDAILRIDKYLQRQQKSIKELFENTHKSSHYYKTQLEIELDSLTGFLIEKLPGIENIEIEVQYFIFAIQDLIYKDLTPQIKNYSQENGGYHPIVLQIELIRVLANNFLQMYPYQTNNIVIDADYNIPKILEYARKYIHAYHFPPKIDNNKKYDIIHQDREKLMYAMNKAIFTDQDNLNPNIFSLFKRINEYINSIHKKPTTNDEKSKIMRTINSFYKDFCKDTYESEYVDDKLLLLKLFWIQSDDIVERSLNIKKYRYENISPTSPLGLFLTLKDHIAQSDKTEEALSDKTEHIIDNIIKALGECDSKDFNELNNEEFQELEKILEHHQYRELRAKIRDIR